jgi:hypothetical protein
MRVSIILMMALFSLPASAEEGEQGTRFIASYDSGKYIVRASEAGVLTIDCSERCASPVSIKDNIGRTNLGIFRLSDANNLLFTTWVGGSSYRAIIYKIDGKNTKKVLDEYAIGGVDFIGSNGKNIVVRIPQFASARDKRRVVRSWRWNNAVGRFQR